jgi:transposase
MFGRETRMLLRHYLEHGTSKSALARQLGVSRDTIHRWIRDGDLDRDLEAEPVRYGPRPPAPTKLDAYKAIIETRLAAYPELSAVRLLDEIRAAGYTGGYFPAESVRAARPPDAAARARHPLRDAGRPPGAGPLRALSIPLGDPLRLAGRARLLAGALVPVLRASGHGHADGRSRGGVP